MWRQQNPAMFRFESYNQSYPIMGNPHNMYGSPNFQQAPPMYSPQPMQQMPYPMYNDGYNSFGAFDQGMHQGQPYYSQPNQPMPQAYSPFANPLQMKKAQQQTSVPYPNPYPKQSFMQKAQPSGFQSVLNQFKTQDGSFDVTKMMNTAGQVVGTVGQVQNMFKGLGGLFKASS